MFGSSLYRSEYNTLRKWLKNARKSSGLTIRELAAQLGVHHSIVGKVESGDRKLELFEFINYCNARCVVLQMLLQKRNNFYCFRYSFPPEARIALGRRELCKALHARNKEVIAESSIILNCFTARYDDMETMSGGHLWQSIVFCHWV